MAEIIHADCVEAMQAMEPESVDAIVCDPPYGLEFMGKEWDRLSSNMGRADLSDRTNFKPTKSEFKDGVGTKIGAPKKNPRCRKCGKLKFDHEKGKCRCKSPDWNTRQSEYAYLQQVWHESWATEALRVLKPGGHLLAFGGTRTYHRLACAVEDAGFEIRDSLIWIYGSGFPKSLDVSKAIDKAAGAEREVVGQRPIAYPDSDCWGTPNANSDGASGKHGVYSPRDGINQGGMRDIEAPATPEAQHWQGWGTALKPSHEPIVVARKPLVGTVAANVLEHGTGALNIDGCRIDAEPRTVPVGERINGNSVYGDGLQGDHHRREDESRGRWPPNITLSHLPECKQTGTRKFKPVGSTPKTTSTAGMFGERPSEVNYTDSDGTETIPAYSCAPGCPVAELDRQSGESTSRVGEPRAGANGDGWGMTATGAEYGDTGGASRFFYVAKASRAERNAGLEGFESVERRTMDGGTIVSDGRTQTRGASVAQNVHPTVKPIALMRWLVRLVTPPEVPCSECGGTGEVAGGGRDDDAPDIEVCPVCRGTGTVSGTILDPFTGSGSTGVAAVLEGFDFVGIEREAEYVALAEARVAFWAQFPGADVDKVLLSDARAQVHRSAGQDSLFVVEESPPKSGDRDGEPTAEQRYTTDGSSNFAMKPGRRRRD